MKTSNQLDGTNDEVISVNRIKCRKKKSKDIEISFQVDGTGPPVCYFTLIFHFVLSLFYIGGRR